MVHFQSLPVPEQRICRPPRVKNVRILRQQLREHLDRGIGTLKPLVSKLQTVTIIFYRFYCVQDLFFDLTPQGFVLHGRDHVGVQISHGRHCHSRHGLVVKQSVPALLQFLHRELAREFRSQVHRAQIVRLLDSNY
jgi:hypothetical protein